MGERRGMKALELWCRRITKGYPGVRITNMTTSWRNGLGFCAIIHHFRPDLIDFDSLMPDDVFKNNTLAFETAETCLSIPALLDPQDMVDYEVPDRLSILTYVSQYYQCFVGQTGVPRKSTSDSVVSASPEPSTPPTTEKHAAAPLRQREPCSVCQLPVFLAERVLIERRLLHRTCFKCARCRSQLSTANYYVTEDGQFCCEVCPDEEIGGRVEKTAEVLAHERAVLAGPETDPLADDADSILERTLSEAATLRRTLERGLAGLGDGKPDEGPAQEEGSSDSESDSDSSGEEEASEVSGAGQSAGGTGESTGETLRASGAALKENECEGVSSEKSVSSDSGEHSVEDKNASGVRDSEDVNVSDENTEKKDSTKVGDEVEMETTLKHVDSSSATSETIASSQPEVSQQEPETHEDKDDADDIHRQASSVDPPKHLSFVQMRMQQFGGNDNSSGKRQQPQPTPRKQAKPKQDCEDGHQLDETPVPVARTKLSSELVEENAGAGSNEDVEEQNNMSVSDRPVEIPSAETLNPFDDDGEEGKAEPQEVEEIKPPVAVSITEPTPEKPPAVKEYNPFDEDEDDEDEETATEHAEEPPEPTPEERTTPTQANPVETKDETKEEEEYPDDLNPFGDDGEEDLVRKPAVQPPPKPPREKPASLNPFGDSEDEEEEVGSAGVTPTSSQNTSPAKVVSPREINPFEKPPRPPPPTLDRRMFTARAGGAGSPVSPRHPDSTGLHREQRSGSLTSLTSSSGKKKRPAPRPPGPQGATGVAVSARGSPTSSLGVSPMGSPATLRKRHAPPPPPIAAQSPHSKPSDGQSSPPKQSDDQSAPSKPLDSQSLPGTQSDDQSASDAPLEAPPSPERSKAEKEQSNYTKMNLTNKSTEGIYKRRKGPAPLRPKPIKRQVKTLPPKETQTELHDINVKQLELERQGVELEKTIRQLTEQEAKQQKEVDSTAPYGLDIEDMILQLFDLVNEKNALFRRQAELMYMRRQHRLEEEHAELEYEIRCIMMKSDSQKTESEREREQQLIDRLVSVVEQRNEIVTMLEMERIREIQEDTAIDYHMERVSSTEPVPDKKKKEKKKKKKKDKEGKKEKESSKKKKKSTKDDDKDIDEKEQATPEKKKSKKIKLKKLFL